MNTFVVIYGLNFEFKMQYLEYLEKKTPKFLRGVFLSCVLETHLDFAHYAVRK